MLAYTASGFLRKKTDLVKTKGAAVTSVQYSRYIFFGSYTLSLFLSVGSNILSFHWLFSRSRTIFFHLDPMASFGSILLACHGITGLSTRWSLNMYLLQYCMALWLKVLSTITQILRFLPIGSLILNFLSFGSQVLSFIVSTHWLTYSKLSFYWLTGFKLATHWLTDSKPCTYICSQVLSFLLVPIDSQILSLVPICSQVLSFLLVPIDSQVLSLLPFGWHILRFLPNVRPFLNIHSYGS